LFLNVFVVVSPAKYEPERQALRTGNGISARAGAKAGDGKKSFDPTLLHQRHQQPRRLREQPDRPGQLRYANAERKDYGIGTVEGIANRSRIEGVTCAPFEARVRHPGRSSGTG
jgi:hypothetical protein